MTWRMLLTLLLLFSNVSWWCGLPPLWDSAAELAEHYVLSPEGSHCNEICVHPSSLVDPPPASSSIEIPHDEAMPHGQLIVLLPHGHSARDHPPPLFSSLSYSLRAPPTLIPA